MPVCEVWVCSPSTCLTLRPLQLPSTVCWNVFRWTGNSELWITWTRTPNCDLLLTSFFSFFFFLKGSYLIFFEKVTHTWYLLLYLLYWSPDTEVAWSLVSNLEKEHVANKRSKQLWTAHADTNKIMIKIIAFQNIIRLTRNVNCILRWKRPLCFSSDVWVPMWGNIYSSSFYTLHFRIDYSPEGNVQV